MQKLWWSRILKIQSHSDRNTVTACHATMKSRCAIKYIQHRQAKKFVLPKKHDTFECWLKWWTHFSCNSISAWSHSSLLLRSIDHSAYLLYMVHLSNRAMCWLKRHTLQKEPSQVFPYSENTLICNWTWLLSTSPEIFHTFSALCWF